MLNKSCHFLLGGSTASKRPGRSPSEWQALRLGEELRQRSCSQGCRALPAAAAGLQQGRRSGALRESRGCGDTWTQEEEDEEDEEDNGGARVSDTLRGKEEQEEVEEEEERRHR